MACSDDAVRAGLAGALDRSEFRLCYQPVFEARGGRVGKVEALLRWHSPQLGGEVPPDRFIPLAEESDLIHGIGRHVFDRVCVDLRTWLDATGMAPRVAVNVSAKQILDDAGLLDHVDALLAHHALAAGHLEVEVTESREFEPACQVRAFADALHARGVPFTMDDFGTGYACLANLVRLPIDRVKIDQMLVQHMGEDGSRTGLVGPLIELVHNLGMTVVAEGVETAHQAAALRSLGCDFLQGFFLQRPIEAPRFLHWWHTHASLH